MYPFINLGILEIQIYQGSQYNLMKVAKILNKINGMIFHSFLYSLIKIIKDGCHPRDVFEHLRLSFPFLFIYFDSFPPSC